MIDEVPAEADALGHTLGIFEICAVIDPAHILDQHREYRALGGDIGRNGRLPVVAVLNAEQLVVLIDIGSVAGLLNADILSLPRSSYLGAVEDEAVALPELLHWQGADRLNGGGELVKAVKEAAAGGEFKLAVFLFLNGYGQLDIWYRGVFGYHFTEAEVFIGQVAAFVDGGVVVIARDGRLIFVKAVCAVHEAEIRTAVEHICRHIPAVSEDIVEARRRVVAGAVVVLLRPVVKPTVPEFGAHQRAVGLIFTQGGELLLGS